MLDYEQKPVDPFLTRGKHTEVVVRCFSHCYHDIPERTFRYNANKIKLFDQTKRCVEKNQRDKVGFDLSDDKFRDQDKEPRGKISQFLSIERL